MCDSFLMCRHCYCGSYSGIRVSFDIDDGSATSAPPSGGRKPKTPADGRPQSWACVMDALNRALPRLPDVGLQRRIHGGWKLSKSSQEHNDSFVTNPGGWMPTPQPRRQWSTLTAIHRRTYSQFGGGGAVKTSGRITATDCHHSWSAREREHLSPRHRLWSVPDLHTLSFV